MDAESIGFSDETTLLAVQYIVFNFVDSPRNSNVKRGKRTRLRFLYYYLPSIYISIVSLPIIPYTRSGSK